MYTVLENPDISDRFTNPEGSGGIRNHADRKCGIISRGNTKKENADRQSAQYKESKARWHRAEDQKAIGRNKKTRKMAIVAIALGVSSCNVTRTITTRSEAWQKGDTSVIIQTKTVETYDASKKGL